MADLRALTVRQPWADLIMAGVKPLENRSWRVPSTLPQWGKCQECERRVWPSRWVENGVPPARFEFMWAGVECRRCDGGLFAADGPFPFRLGIHAAKTWDDDAVWSLLYGRRKGWAWPVPAAGSLHSEGRSGVLLGTVEITGCHHADECYGHYGQSVSTDALYGREPMPPKPEWRHCSRWAEPHAYHWTLSDPEPLDVPIPMKGRLGLWRLPEEVRRG